jgi:hypothetical protein
VTTPDADIDRIVANETAINFDGRDLLAEVEQLQEALAAQLQEESQYQVQTATILQLREERDRLAEVAEAARRQYHLNNLGRGCERDGTECGLCEALSSLPEREDG